MLKEVRMKRYLYCPGCNERVYEVMVEPTFGMRIDPSHFRPARDDVRPPKGTDKVECPLCHKPWQTGKHAAIRLSWIREEAQEVRMRLVGNENLRRVLAAIDECKERIAKCAPSEAELVRMEREFVVDTVYHSMRIEGGQLTREETERVLFPDEA